LGKGGKYVEKEMYSKRILKDLEPSIRFCQYNLTKDKKDLSSIVEDIENVALDLLKSKLDDVLEESRKKQIETLEEIEFSGKKVHIKNDKIKRNIIQAEGNISEIKKATDNESKLKIYEKILYSYADVLGMIKDDIKLKVKKKNSMLGFSKHFY
jgi:D-mannonate dehydratase